MSYYSKALEFFKLKVSNKVTKKNDHFEGVKGLYAFAKLFYADIAKHICWDPFHVIMNICSHLLGLWMNERGTSAAVRTFCKEHHMHPSLEKTSTSKNNEKPPMDAQASSSASAKISSDGLTDSKSKESDDKNKLSPDWVFTPLVQTMIDIAVASIQIPTGCKQNFQVRSIFQAPGHLNGISKIHILVVLMDIINFCLFHYGNIGDVTSKSDHDKYPLAYLFFYKILSSDICSLMSRSFTDEAIDDLLLRVMETVSLYEGMFPPCEALPVNHHLVDITAHVKVFGPIMTWWTIGGERAVGDTAKFSTTGGTKNYVTAMNRSIEEMDAMFEATFDIDEKEFQRLIEGDNVNRLNSNKKHSTSFLFDKAEDCLKYDNTSKKYVALPYRSYCSANNIIRHCQLSLSETMQVIECIYAKCKKSLSPNSIRMLLNKRQRSSQQASGSSKESHAYENLCKESLLFRLYIMFEVARAKENSLFKAFYRDSDKRVTFANWLRCVYDSVGKCLNEIFFIRQPVQEESCTVIYSNLVEGLIYMSDMQFIEAHLEKFRHLSFDDWFIFYQSVHHGGIVLRGRYDGTQIATGGDQQEYSFVQQRLSENWSDKQSKNCFIFYNDGETSDNDPKYCVGKAALFLTSNFPREIGNVCSDEIWCLLTPCRSDERHSKPFFSGLRFVHIGDEVVSPLKVLPIRTVLASPIAFHPLVINNLRSSKPMFYQKAKFNFKRKLKKSIAFVTNNETEVNILCCYPLKPYNRSLG
jgi:hypothetical protein